MRRIPIPQIVLAAFILSVSAMFLTGVPALRESGSLVSGSSPFEPTQREKVFFERNDGQFDKKVRYKAVGTDGHTMFLTDEGPVYVLRKVVGEKKRQDLSDPLPRRGPEARKAVESAVFIEFPDAGEDTSFSAEGLLVHRTSHFRGSDPSGWQTGVPNFSSVSLDLGIGVAVRWDGSSGFDLESRNQGSVGPIEILIKGADSASVSECGDLKIETGAGTLTLEAPAVRDRAEFGSLVPRSSGWIISDGASEADGITVSIVPSSGTSDKFKEGSAERKPSNLGGGDLAFLGYSSYLGGASIDFDPAVTLDSSRHPYVVATTGSSDFPTTPGTYDTSVGPAETVTITKLNRVGSQLVFSTFLHGQFSATGTDIDVDHQGNVYVAGHVTGNASPANFPTTPGAFDETFNGESDVFITKLNNEGTDLIYSTYLGGGGTDTPSEIFVNGEGELFIAGTTRTPAFPPDFPTTAGAFDQTHNGNDDVFVSKLSADGSSLLYSTFVGGNEMDSAAGLAVDLIGDIYVTGITESDSPTTGFPTTPGAFETSMEGIGAFVFKIDPTEPALQYSTFIHSSNEFFMSAADVEVDNNGRATVVGFTLAPGFPVTVNAYDPTHNGGRDVYITKFNASGASLEYSTFLGSDQDDVPWAVEVDQFDEITVIGTTEGGFGTFFPTTVPTFDGSYNGSGDTFVTKFRSDGVALQFSTFLGGDGNDSGRDVVVDGNGNITFVGHTVSGTGNFPTAPGSYDTTPNSLDEEDLFVGRLGLLETDRIPLDFDGDGRTDLAIFRPNPQPPLTASPLIGSTSQWWILNSTDLSTLGITFGQDTDQIIPRDFTGDGLIDVAFFRPSTGEWYVLRSEDSSFFAFPFGTNGDRAAAGDFDGDGTADPAVYRPSSGTWFILRSSDAGVSVVPFGVAEDRPTVADFDGDGMDDIAIFRPSVGQWWQLRTTLGVIGYQVGTPEDIPAIGDYTGDGRADVAFFRPSNSNWYVIRSEDSSFFAFPWGAAGDIPAPGDYDGDSITDPAVFRGSEGVWYLLQSTNGFLAVPFGVNGDVPLPGN